VREEGDVTRKQRRPGPSGSRDIIIKSADEIARMRRAGQVIALTLDRLAHAARPGVTTAELDAIAEATIRSFGAIPSFHNLYGYPANICTSVNEEVVHGIPGDRALRDGDILSVDVGATVEDRIADGAATFAVGTISPEAERLLRVTQEALHKGIAQAKAGNRVVDISRAVQEHVESHGYSVVRQLVGHGVGRQMHEAPQVPNFVSASAPGLEVLAPGLTIAIEPMVNEGVAEVVQDGDGWTYRTRDGRLSAHFEHTVAITERGCEILTQRQAPARQTAGG
jgi:methionyl aminopeptidase